MSALLTASLLKGVIRAFPNWKLVKITLKFRLAFLRPNTTLCFLLSLVVIEMKAALAYEN